MCIHLFRYYVPALLLFCASTSFASIRINEICAESSDRLLSWSEDNGATLGTGPNWFEASYTADYWKTGTGPFGFGESGIATDLSADMAGIVSCYMRQSFSVSSGNATSSQNLILDVDYNDGFVAYLNGVEVLRKNAGGTGAFVYHDQPAFNIHLSSGTSAYVLGIASDLLEPGENLLAIQVHNQLVSDGTLKMSAALRISGGATLATAAGPWAYLAGDHEPSGGIVDYSRLPSNAEPPALPWTLSVFDDSSWLQGVGGVGYGDGDDATDIEHLVRNKAWSVYYRRSFTINAAIAGSTNALSLSMDYDDGFVAYLNGHEIARRMLGSVNNFVSHDTAAENHEAGLPDVISITNASQFLVEGQNVLAIQLHNHTFGSSDMTMLANLDLTGPSAQSFVQQADVWNYFIGTEEPSAIPEAAIPPEDISDFVDWVELVNTGAVAISLANWGLTDDAGEPHKWVFPDLTLQPGEHMLVLCTGLDITNTLAPFLHTNFKLGRKGEYIGLYSPGAVVVSEIEPEFPRQDPGFTYGWDAASGAYRYQKQATPKQLNAGGTFDALPGELTMLPASGFYDTSVSVTITNTSPTDQIYYSTDGSVPTATSGTQYTGSFSVSSSTAIRAVAVASAGVESTPITRNYLVNEPQAIKSLPAVCLTADWETGLHKPHGITSVVGGQWVTGEFNSYNWEPLTDDDYDIPVQRGRSYERRAHMDLLYPDSPIHTNYQSDCGIRIAGSDWSRPQFRFQDLSGTWNGHPHIDKPQFNVFFRSDYGNKRFKHPVFPAYADGKLKSIRLRSGKNDWNNPFIIDELMRRTMSETGQAVSTGIQSSLFVNGEFRCYYNPTPRYDEAFFQQAYNSSQDFDIVGHGGISEGDDLAFIELFAFLMTHDLSNPDHYREAERHIDIENFIDYLIVNSHGGTWDWPQNNWSASRERSALGRWRFFMWDAEGAYGYGWPRRYPQTFNMLTTSLIGNTNSYISIIFNYLYASDIFRQHWYDRAWKHLSDGEALDTNELMVKMNTLSDELNPIMNHVRGSNVDLSRITDWIQNRRTPLIQNFRDAGMWFDITPPLFSVPGGNATNGMQIALSHTNGAGVIYYSLDGSDPRGPGGTIIGTEYTGPITIDRSRHIKARVLNGGVWGALGEETYITAHPKLVISEIMYHPVDPLFGSPYGADDFEFVELHNAEASAIPLDPVYIDSGISFDFSGNSLETIQPGQYVVLVKNIAAFATRYDTNSITIAGTYTGKFSDSGEMVKLQHDHYGLLMFGDYADGWYDHTDGDGYSLTLRNVVEPGLFDEKLSWKPSSVYGGTPGQPDPDSVPEPGAVVLNELLSHTDLSPVGDWVEIYNTTLEPIDLSGWTLSDSGTNLAKYIMPPATILPATNYIVLNAFNHFDHPSSPSPFAFSEHGDEAILTSAEVSGKLTGYRDRADFNGAEREVTFGRHVRSDGKTDWTTLSASTPMAANAYPKIGPLVLLEVCFEPALGEQEFIQFYNMTSSNLPLFDPAVPTNVWSINGGIDYVFPTNTWIPAHEGLIVTGGDPEAFRSTHAIPAEKPVLGPFSGALANEGDSIKLYRPGVPDEGGIPRIRVERVEYNDKLPWPLMPTNGGPSLVRNQINAYGNDPATWSLGSVSGNPIAATMVDSDSDGLPDRWEAQFFLLYDDPADADLDPDLDQMNNSAEYIAGTQPNHSNSVFNLKMTSTNQSPAIELQTILASGSGYDGLRRVYSIEYRSNLTSTVYFPVPGAEAIDSTGGSIVITNSISGDHQYYRGKVHLLPQ